MSRNLKKKIRYFLMTALTFLIWLSVFKLENITVFAANLDKIHDYVITIDSQDDGSLSMRYHIEWEVLDSTTEGPLTWVKIGIPNEYVEDIIPLSNCIDKIGYYSKGGDYVRIDFDQEYKRGDVVSFDFSIHQHQMYKEDNNMYYYSFTPGWFDEIYVDHIKIRWKAKKDITSMSMEKEGGYFVYEDSGLIEGERVSVDVMYPLNSFDFHDNYKEQIEKQNHTTAGYILSGLYILIPGAILFWILAIRRGRKERDYYTSHSGMGSYYYRNHVSRNNSSHHGGGGCACACACACAGGGRAGCSAKEFYSAKHWKLRKQD